MILYLYVIIALLICISLYEVYKMFNNKTNIIEGLADNKRLAEQDVLTERQGQNYYGNRKDNPMGLIGFGQNNNNSQIGPNILKCRKLTDCDDLDDNPMCGYCAETKVFSAGNTKGPFADACKPEKWSIGKAQCKKKKEQEECSKLTNCGDLVGDIANKCAYCPTNGKMMSFEKVNGKNVPKYGEDCDYMGGLITGDKCASFAEDHPCITPNKETGPHNEKCIRKIWKNSGCTNTKVANTDMSLLTSLKKSYEDLTNKFNKINKEASTNNNYDKANNFNKECYGDDKELDPCEPRFGSNDKCKEKIFLETGCNEKSWQKLKESNNSLLNLSNNQFKNKIEDIHINANTLINLQNKDKVTKSAMLCYGKIPPPPKPLGVGDFVKTKHNNWVMKGYIMKIVDQKCYILWTNVGGLKREKVRNNNNFIKIFFGWDGIKGTHSKLTRLGDSNGGIHINKLKRIKKCEDKGIFYCGNSCSGIIKDLRSKYPKPLDCVVGEWSLWGDCNKPCGGGIKKRIRKKIYEEVNGGTCDEQLIQYKRCNMRSCLRDDFSKVDIKENFQNETVWNKADHKLIKGVRYIKIENKPYTYLHIQEIEAYDENNKNIAHKSNGVIPSSSSLIWTGSNDMPINGIKYGGIITEKKWLVNKGTNPKKLYGALEECEGDCDRDSDCAPGLKCYQRRSSNNEVPGCRKGRQGDKKHHDYCYDPKKGGEGVFKWPNSNITGKSKYEYYEIDLRKNRNIWKLVIFNRPDCCKGRLSGAKVKLLDSNKRELISPITLTSNDRQTFTF